MFETFGAGKLEEPFAEERKIASEVVLSRQEKNGLRMMVYPGGKVRAGAWLDGRIGRIAGTESGISLVS